MRYLRIRAMSFLWFLMGCLFVLALFAVRSWAIKTPLTEWKDIATIVGIIGALLTYGLNSWFQFRSKRIENLTRYFDAHNQLFEERGFIRKHIKELEANDCKRDAEDPADFNGLLGGLEKIAYLTSYAAVPKEIQVYLFGWFAQRIQPLVTAGERNNVFWELAVHYLDELKKAADDYEKQPNERRERYLRKNALGHRNFM
ncbi:MAG TPA: hypothetical protein VIH72_03530 [Candidatus Acidoferrales bacterium]|jgi:hypothetical protein